ncbi:RidA family protein [Mesorhizobium sp. AD1-1]|uniref:RidA family protein n=1 Tax=Mesorhizobium sp. AD1-1 TaxID=2876621 RepID=UPI001CCE7ECD|nr:RidA family protein [Mesorhizobium sp. AD1-1]MBZ9719208.1 RidA family protein [Mesorhizobium sp. AD1-1]
MIERFGVGPRLSKAVKFDHLVFLAGEVANDPQLDLRQQTAAVLARIDAQLAQCGANKSSILYAQVWLADMSGFDAMNEVWDSWIDTANPPARATVGAQLAKPFNLVEIQVVAATER